MNQHLKIGGDDMSDFQRAIQRIGIKKKVIAYPRTPNIEEIIDKKFGSL